MTDMKSTHTLYYQHRAMAAAGSNDTEISASPLRHRQRQIIIKIFKRERLATQI